MTVIQNTHPRWRRNSIGETDGPVTATSMISPMIEEIGPICGCAPWGRRPCTVASRSATCCRAR